MKPKKAAQVEQAGQADYYVQAQAQHHIDQYQGGQVNLTATGQEREGQGGNNDDQPDQFLQP